MSLDKATVARIAHLARIRTDDAQLDALVGDLNNILGFVEQLNEVNTDNVEPLASVTGHGLPMRKDEVTDGAYPDRVLANAPERAHGYYAVPKVVE
ncbi:Asp-tRNA(Asn)/Glu-tRNA(Gln) amidotransferase subunit GatC [Nisaea sp.]|jgi:aspartyl-tRNA(Asn)/glutamyl-tRNA(Gln) amidotransferase subunit C|uniref:Asp-tRNA(Asn)/Glu-tRNA(Gln) amidotransferase subunit GatC n=1 Tax=Nisaea sp. TaxID=2024842 RepID=UPI003B526E57